MMTPIGKRILLRPLFDKMSGAILIPEDQQQSQTGEVLALGTKISLPVKVSDRVLFHPNAAWTNVEVEGEQLRVMNEEYLMAIMEMT